MTKNVYIKPMTWNGNLRFYIGLHPSNSAAGSSDRLGGYFLIVKTIESARAVAESEVRRMNGLGHEYAGVVECPHYVGLERLPFISGLEQGRKPGEV